MEILTFIKDKYQGLVTMEILTFIKDKCQGVVTTNH